MMKRRPSEHRFPAVCSAVLVVASAGAAAAAPAIFGLGVLPSRFESQPTAISGDGRVVVGQSSGRPFRWTVDSGLQSLTIPDGGGTIQLPSALSFDGSVIVGVDYPSAAPLRPVRWAASAVEVLASPAAGNTGARAITADGSHIYGYAGTSGVRWPASGSPVLLTGVAGIVSVTPDGSLALAATQASPATLTRVNLADPDAPVTAISGAQTGRTSISRDGSVVSLTVLEGTTTRAYRWTSGDLLQPLFTPAGTTISAASTISGDGTLIGGSVTPFNQLARAVLWSDQLGYLDLNTSLPALGVDLTGWHLQSVVAISDDGRTITGTGVFAGITQAFVVTNIPAPTGAAGLALAGGLVAVRRRRR